MVEAQFYSDIGFANYLEDAEAIFGKVPGTVDHGTLSVHMTLAEFSEHELDLRSLVKDYGGQLRHHRVI